MAGSTWPSLVAGAKAKASEVESKFDWSEQDYVPHNAGTRTDNTYDLGTATHRWRDLHMGRQILAAVGSAGTPGYSVDGRTTDGIFSPAAAQLTISLSGTAKHNFNQGSYRPQTDINVALGESGNRFSRLFVGTGTVGAPAIAVSTEGNGFYADAANRISVAIGSTQNSLFINEQVLARNGSATAPSFSFISSNTKGMYRDSGSDDLRLVNNSTDQLIIDTSGHITQPNQSCFLAIKSSSTAVNIGSALTLTTVGFDSEIYDQNADFNSVDTFTAPVTGRYHLSAVTTAEPNTTASFTYNSIRSQIVTSNRTYINQDGQLVVAAGLRYAHTINVIADMDAGDTASIRFSIGSQSDTSFIFGTSSPQTYFSGSLIN